MNFKHIIYAFSMVALLASCAIDKKETATTASGEFNHFVEDFADIKVLRYTIDGFDELTLKEKKLVYYLTQAGLSGRDIMWDQN